MRNTLPTLSIPLPTSSRPTQPASAMVDIHQPVPTICLIDPTSSALGACSDASTSAARNNFDPPPSTSLPLAPRPITTSNASSRKRLVPKKSKLGLLGAVKGHKERSQNDFSDVVRRIGGVTSAGRGGYEIYVDHTEDPDLEEIVLVKRKKSRLGLDAVAWGTSEENTATVLKPKPSSNALKSKGSENVSKPKSSVNTHKFKSKDKENSIKAKPVEHLLKPKSDESQKWWSIGRGRKDSKELKEPHRSKSPEPEKKSLRSRFGSLDSGIMLSSPTSASHPHPPYSFGTNSSTLLAPPIHIEPEPSPASPAEGMFGTPSPGLLAPPIEREVSASGSIALRAMKSMARLASWSQPKTDEKEEGAEKKRSKKNKKEKEVIEKRTKEKKGKDDTIKMSSSSFETGTISNARIPKVSLEIPSEDGAPKTIGKKQSVLGLGLPSSLRFGTVRSAVSTVTSSTADLKEENRPVGTVRRTSVSSAMSLNLLTSRRPSSTVSNSSSLRPPSTASGMSRSSSSSASVKWDEEGLETVKEMRRKDREERRRNSTDSSAVLNDATKKGSRRSAEGRKRPLVSDLFAEVDISSRPTSPEVQSQCSSGVSGEGPIVNIETATNDGHGHASDPETLETPMKRARPRPMSEQMLGNIPRPQGIYNNVERAMSMSLLDAATDDLASLINRLDLEATPRTPDVSPFTSVHRSLTHRGSAATLESPLTHAKRCMTTAGSPLRTSLNRASTTSSVASLRPYIERKSIGPKSHAVPMETKKPQSGNEHLVGQHIYPWEDLNWNVSPIKKVKASSPTTRPTHKRTMSPPMPFDPPPVFQPLHPPKNRVPSNPKSTKNSPETKTAELRPCTPSDGNQPPLVPTSTFGERPNKISRPNGLESLDTSTHAPVFSRRHSRNKSSLGSNRLFCIPMASETKVELGLRGTMGSASLPDVDLEEPDSDIPTELQFLLTNHEEREDTLSFTESARSTSPEPSILPTLIEIAIPPAEPIPIFRAQVFHAGCASGDSDVTSDEDTKKSFDFTGEIRMLNESGASDRRSFVEQLENAFKTPARIDLKYTFPEHTVDIPSVPTLPVNIQDPSVATLGLSATVDSFLTEDIEVSESHSTIYSDDEEYCRRLSSPANTPSVDIVRERPANPLASSRNSRPSDGQLNRSFRFGGSPMPSQRSGDSSSDGVLTLSDIIPPHSQLLPKSSGCSLVEEASSLLNSIMAQATVLPVASEVAVPRVRPRVGSNTCVQGVAEEFSRDSSTSQISGKSQTRTSFAGFDSFDEVRRGFEFGPNRPVFYPPISLSHNHNKHDSIFSVASVSSFGSVIDNGAPDPFGYARHSRPPSEDMSISMSMTVDDTFSFMYQKRRSRVDSDASSFYFKSQPSMVGPLRRGHRAHDSIISTSGAPPVSLYNRSHHGHGHRRGDSSGSVSSVALSYALHGANGGRATWVKHSRNDPSIDSVISDYSFMMLSRPGLGDKMLDSEFDHGVPLSAISASPNQSFDSGLYDEYQHQERTAFDSIMDTRRSMTCDSLMDDGSDKVSNTFSVFFEHSRVPLEAYSVQSHFRPISIISTNSSYYAPREDDTMISMLGGGRVRRVSLGSVMQQSPCARAEKRSGKKKRPVIPKVATLHKPEPVQELEDADEGVVSPVKSVIVSRPSIASVTSTKFGGERMIKARKGLLERQSLEDSCLIADGEELASFAKELSFSRPRPGPAGGSRSSTCTTSSSGSETPPLSSDASSFDGSQSSIDVGQLSSMLSNVTHPMTRPTHGRTRARGQGHGHRPRPSDARHSMASVYETIQEEGPGPVVPIQRPEMEIPVAVYNSVNSIHIAGDSDGTDIEWDDERGIIALRKCGVLKNEADDAVTESKRIWLDTPFSLFAVQSFHPPNHPSGMKAMLEHSQQTYGPLPLELCCHRIRSRTYSRPSPYPQRIIKQASPERSPPQKAEEPVADVIVQPLQPKSINTNSKTPAPAIKNFNPISPFAVDFEKCKGDKSLNERTIRPRVASSTRRAALGWSKRSTGKTSELKENTSIGTLNTPTDSLRLSRPRPRSRPTPGTGIRTRGAENVPPVPPLPPLRY